MTRRVGRVVAAVTLAFGTTPAVSWAQDQAAASREPRWILEAAAGIQVQYDGSVQSLAFGFAPSRSLTALVRAERSSVEDRIETYSDGYAAERGSTEQFISGEVHYAFLTRRRVSPYVLGGLGRGTSRPNVSQTFSDTRVRTIHVVYYGGGVRIPVAPHIDALVDARLIMSMEGRSDYFRRPHAGARRDGVAVLKVREDAGIRRRVARGRQARAMTDFAGLLRAIASAGLVEGLSALALPARHAAGAASRLGCRMDPTRAEFHAHHLPR